MKNAHCRKSIRLKGYDYSKPGAYFVTICSQDHMILFENEDVRAMVTDLWKELGTKYPQVRLNEYVLMPNHLHGIIHIVGADLRVRPKIDSCSPPGEGEYVGPPLRGLTGGHIGPPLQTAGDMVRWFKTMITNHYVRGVRENKWPPFKERLWQRNYYEHIIRGESALDKIREYIRYNPVKWELDIYNPDCGESYKGFEDYLRGIL